MHTTGKVLIYSILCCVQKGGGVYIAQPSPEYRQGLVVRLRGFSDGMPLYLCRDEPSMQFLEFLHSSRQFGDHVDQLQWAGQDGVVWWWFGDPRSRWEWLRGGFGI